MRYPKTSRTFIIHTNPIKGWSYKEIRPYQQLEWTPDVPFTRNGTDIAVKIYSNYTIHSPNNVTVNLTINDAYVYRMVGRYLSFEEPRGILASRWLPISTRDNLLETLLPIMQQISQTSGEFVYTHAADAHVVIDDVIVRRRDYKSDEEYEQAAETLRLRWIQKIRAEGTEVNVYVTSTGRLNVLRDYFPNTRYPKKSLAILSTKDFASAYDSLKDLRRGSAAQNLIDDIRKELRLKYLELEEIL